MSSSVRCTCSTFPPASTTTIRSGAARGDPPEPVRDTQVERLVQPLVAVGGVAPARQPLPRHFPWQIEQQGQVRLERGQRDQVADEGERLRRTVTQPVSLVGQRRVEEPVADHQVPLGQGRDDRVLDMVEPCCKMHQDLGAEAEPVIPLEQQRPQPLGTRSTTRLPGVQQPAVLFQPFGQQARLGRLAGSLAALERDEQPAHEPPTKWSSTATARAGRLLRSTAAAATSGTWTSATEAPEMVIRPTCWPARIGAGSGA